MRIFGMKLVAAATLVAATTIVSGSAGAVPAAPGALRAVADDLNAVETVQFIWGGRDYCWYDDGWNGPGWYWCGYSYRRGFGWGGGVGWHGWGRGGGGVIGRPVGGGQGGGVVIGRPVGGGGRTGGGGRSGGGVIGRPAGGGGQGGGGGGVGRGKHQ